MQKVRREKCNITKTRGKKINNNEREIKKLWLLTENLEGNIQHKVIFRSLQVGYVAANVKLRQEDLQLGRKCSNKKPFLLKDQSVKQPSKKCDACYDVPSGKCI